MAQTKAKSLSKLVALQKLGASRLEASLVATNMRRAALDEEREGLIAMQDRHYDSNAFTIDPSLLIRRMSANASAQARVEQELVNARNALLKEQRRVEHLEKRLLTVRSEDERKEFSMQIEEFISRATTLKTK
ncbi:MULTISPECIES: hypothetical protein [unclassified Ochrobactrum]|uniref:hypothetical protein n=1 Tax=unclassified Ochrobactrum TaxID=239106 RepID=UPI0030A6F575